MSNQLNEPKGEQWGSRIGVILAVAGSAVGLGNFLRFPGKAAAFGGGAFMIPYFVALLLLGIPICWLEWAMGRRGGRYGLNSSPGIFYVVWRNPIAKYLGALGLLIPVVIYMYYVYIESWCLAYACNYATGKFDSFGKNPFAYEKFFAEMTGSHSDGLVFNDDGVIQAIFFFFLVTFLVNFVVIYRGLSKGIETFCKVAMPMLILAAVVVAARVLTLPEQPIPLPWQRSLALAVPASQWQAFREQLPGAAFEPSDSNAPTVQKSLETAFEGYFRALTQREAGYDANIAVAPPRGFLASPDGYRMAVAELNAGPTGDDYRRWIEKVQQTLSTEAKRTLQKLERRQLAIDKTLASLESRIASAKTSNSSVEPLERELANAESKRDEIEASRSEILAKASSDPMPSLAMAATSLGVDPKRASAVQDRAAAIEAAELRRTVYNGLGYMWNPDFEELANPNVWLQAAGQIFFTLSVGFGVILNYASYLKRKDDVVLSGLTASATNEFCEVSLGGLVAIPATFIFLGTATTLAVLDSQSTFGLGFNTLPTVFANMPAGRWFGTAWFGLLFLAGITSSLSMLQPAIAFIEEGFGMRRRASVAWLGLITMAGALPVIYFSTNQVVLDTLDFWVGSFALFVLATIEVLVFGWILGIGAGFQEAHLGAQMRIPWIFRPILKFVTPTFLLAVLVAWSIQNAPDYIARIRSNPVVMATVIGILSFFAFLLLLVKLAGEEWKRTGRGEREVEA